MKLKRYQETAVDKLLKASRILLAKDGQRVCVFKAPTGSGKTIVVADYLRNLADEQLPSKYAFLWISGNDLHKQSRGKLEDYLNPSRYTFSYLDDIQNNELKENEIAFVYCNAAGKLDLIKGKIRIQDTLIGHSQISVPFKGCIKRLEHNKEEMFIQELDTSILNDSEVVYKIRKD